MSGITSLQRINSISQKYLQISQCVRGLNGNLTPNFKSLRRINDMKYMEECDAHREICLGQKSFTGRRKSVCQNEPKSIFHGIEKN